MASPSGISAQLGYVSESVYGTGVTVTKFLPFVSEKLAQQIERIESKGLRAGRKTLAKWKPGSKKVGGSIKLELPTRDIATLLNHCFGGVATTGTGPYTHTLTPGDLTGKSFTTQIGRPDITGTVQPFTYTGCKVKSWELSAGVDELVMLDLDVVAQAESTATALAAASYNTNLDVFSFVGATLTLAGSEISVSKFSLKGDNGLLAERFRSNGSTTKEPLEADFRAYTGTLEADFESLTAYNRFVNGTEASLVIALANGADTLTITMNVRFDGETPDVEGPTLVGQSLPFVALSSTSDAAAITAVLVNQDSSAA